MLIGLAQPRVRALLRRLLTSGLDAVDPAVALHRHVKRRGTSLHIDRRHYDLSDFSRIVAVGAGKASGRMAAALEEILGHWLSGGLVVVKHGDTTFTKKVRLIEAGHPVPDQRGQKAAAQLLALVGDLGARDLVFVLLSGGASSLLPAPVPGLTLLDKQRTTQLLLRSGATIHEINTVRKHLSSLKGGRLVAATPATIIALILSDVLGDDPSTIASGPTAPDPTTYHDACAILRRHFIWRKVPKRVRKHLLLGARGEREESPKPGSPLFRRVHNAMIGNNRAAVDAVMREARRAGLHTLLLSTSLIGEAREAARLFAAIGREIKASGQPIKRPACLIAGGELTVTVRGGGQGGRAQEFALAAAQEIAGLHCIYIAAFGTDGTDGPTDAAGAVVNGQTARRAARLGLDVAESLRCNDAYPLLKKLGSLITTGPTGTNVNDLYLLIVL